VNVRIVEWRTPTPQNRKRQSKYDQQYREVAENLRLNPERWALIATDANTNLAEGIKRGRNQYFRPAGSFEATCRGTKKVDGKFLASEIFARYVGKSES